MLPTRWHAYFAPHLLIGIIVSIYFDLFLFSSCTDELFDLESPLPDEMLTYARSDTHFLLYIYDQLRLSLIERAKTIPGSETYSSNAVSVIKKGSISDKPQHVLLNDVLARSTRTALKLYDRERYDAESGTGTGGWDTLAQKWNKSSLASTAAEINGVRGGTIGDVYRAVHGWREDVAREEDESTR